VALAALAVAALVVNAVVGPSPRSNAAARRYLPASDFSFTLYQGEAQLGRTEGTLAQFRGRPVILHFWGSGCRPCLEELPRLQDLHEQAGGKAIVMGVDVGLLLDRGTREEAQAALLQHHVTYPVGFPKDSSLVEQYNLRRIPTTVFINRRGEVFRRWAGPMRQEDLLGIAGALLEDDGRRR
jgi:thiol-disulfide isomerase/thioredoxin